MEKIVTEEEYIAERFSELLLERDEEGKKLWLFLVAEGKMTKLEVVKLFCSGDPNCRLVVSTCPHCGAWHDNKIVI